MTQRSLVHGLPPQTQGDATSLGRFPGLYLSPPSHTRGFVPEIYISINVSPPVSPSDSRNIMQEHLSTKVYLKGKKAETGMYCNRMPQGIKTCARHPTAMRGGVDRFAALTRSGLAQGFPQSCQPQRHIMAKLLAVTEIRRPECTASQKKSVYFSERRGVQEAIEASRIRYLNTKVELCVPLNLFQWKRVVGRHELRGKAL